jgi:ribosomal protein S18 acetylase RimI-like enzyme
MLARPARLVARPTLRARLSLSPSLASALLPARAMMSSWSFDGIEYRRLDPDYDPEALFAFNKEHGSTPLNFIPDEPVREHFRRLATGETTVWAAFAGDEMAGFISGELGGGYWLQTGAGQEHSSDNDGSTCFINEFVVNPKFRGKRIGVRLTTASIDPELGIWATDPAIHEMYTTVHVDNLASRTAFIKVRAVSAVSADAVSSSPRRSPQQHRMVLGGAGCMGSFIRGGRFLLPPPRPRGGGRLRGAHLCRPAPRPQHHRAQEGQAWLRARRGAARQHAHHARGRGAVGQRRGRHRRRHLRLRARPPLGGGAWAPRSTDKSAPRSTDKNAPLWLSRVIGASCIGGLCPRPPPPALNPAPMP